MERPPLKPPSIRILTAPHKTETPTMKDMRQGGAGGNQPQSKWTYLTTHRTTQTSHRMMMMMMMRMRMMMMMRIMMMMMVMMMMMMMTTL